MKSHRLHFLITASAAAFCLATGSSNAQQSQSAPVANSQSGVSVSGSQTLPPVTIESSRPKKQRASRAAGTRSQSRASRVSAAPKESRPVVEVEQANGPVRGYVANRSATATKSDTALIDTPASISVVTRDQIMQQNAQSLNEAVRYSPGVIVDSRGAVATRYDLLKIRGFDAVNYYNGIRMQKMNWVAPQVDPYLLERIEVLRGPSSVMYGQAPTGGMLNQISKMPTTTPFGEVGVEFGNFDHKRTTFDLGGPIDPEGKYSYRLTGIGRMDDGQVKDTEATRGAIAPAFTWRPTNDTTLTLLGLFQRDPKSNSYVGVPSAGSVGPNPLGRIPRDLNVSEPSLEKFDRTQSSAGYLFSHRFSDSVTLRMNGQWFSSNIDYFSVYGASLLADNRTLTRSVSQSHDEMDALGFDNQLEFKFGVGPFSHTLLTGFDSQYADGFYVSGTGTAPSIDIFNPVYGRAVTPPATRRTDVTSKQFGFYVQDEIRFGGFIATLATRLDQADSNTLTSTGLTLKRDHAVTSRAALLYHFDSGVAPYVSYAESFTPTAGTDAAGRVFDPETGVQYEVGVKYQPIGYNALITAALFDLTRNNLLTTDLANRAFSVQVGQAKSRGFELEAKTSLTSGLSMVGSYTYLDTKYTRDNSGLLGLVPVGVPGEMASIWGYYTFPSSTAVDGLSFGAGVRYVGSSYNTNNTLVVPAVTLVDAALKYELGARIPELKGATLSVNAKNLFDKEYVGACYTSTICAYGWGRVVTAGLQYRW